MADLEKSVAIIFEGVDQMGSAVDSVTRKVDDIAYSTQRATQPMADLTKNVFAFEAALLAAGAGAALFAVKLAGDFDSQFREISTLIDAPTESLAAFRQEILDYSTESTQSLSTVNSALYNAISAGVDYADSLDVVRLAEQAAVAGKADLDQALGVIVASLNAYGEGMDEAERFSDLLFTTVAKGVTTLPELGASLGSVTGLAATAGVSFEELLAAIATLTATGSTTSGAVTQIQAAISNLLKPTKQAADLADELGIEFNAAALESKGLSGVLLDVQEATGGNTEQMAQLFGSVQALNGMLTLTGLGAESFAENIEAMGNATGATEAAYEKMAGTIEQGSQRIFNAMQGALIAVGTPLLDEFSGIQEAIAAIFNAIGASVQGGQLQGFVDQLESLFGGIEDTLREVARNLPQALEQADFSSFFNGIELVRDAIAGLFDGADLTSADGLASVIETLGLAFETLSAYTAGAITALEPFLEQMARLVQFVLEIDPKWAAWVGAIGGASLAINTLATAVIALNAPVKAIFGGAGLIAKGTPIVAGLVSVLSGPVGLAAAVGLAGVGLVNFVRDIAGLNDSVDPATQAIRDQLAAIEDGRLVWDFAVNDWVKAGEAQEDLAARTRRLNEEFSDALLGIDRQAEARERESRMMQEVNDRYTDYGAMVEKAWQNSQSFADEQERTAQGLRAVMDEIGPLGSAWEEVNDGVFQQVNNVDALRDAYNDARAAFDEGLITESQFEEIESYYQSMVNGAEAGKAAQAELAGEVLTTEESILKARQAVLDYELELEKLASNERIRNLELTVDLSTAQLEADTQRIQAAFDSINVGIQSTGETLTSLWNLLGSGDLSRFDELDLKKQIESENQLREEQFDLQKRLTEAQIEQMRAQTDALRNGDGLIKIESDGLEPALEMIMWQIIEKVQLRANAEGAEFLLGI